MERPASSQAALARRVTLACIESPLQALNLLEYLDASGSDVDVVVMDDNVDSGGRNVSQVERVLATEGLAIDVIVDRRGTYHDPFRMRRQVGALRHLVGDADRVHVIGGEYRSNVLWALINECDDRIDRVTFVDDGTAMLRIRRDVDPSLSPIERIRAFAFARFGLDWSPTRPIELFSAYADELRAGPADQVVPNDYRVCRRRIASIETDPDLTLVVGNAFVQAEVVSGPDVAIELAMQLVDQAAALAPMSQVRYVRHRREHPDVVAAVAARCDVVTNELPFEMLPIELGVVPGRVVGYYSSVLNNLARVGGGTTELHSIRLDPAVVAARHRAFVESVYASYERSEDIVVHDPPRTSPSPRGHVRA